MLHPVPHPRPYGIGRPHKTAHRSQPNTPSHALVASIPARKLARTIPDSTVAVRDLETSRSAHRWRSCSVPTCTWKSSPLASPFSSVSSSGDGRVHWPVEHDGQGEDGTGGEGEKMEGR